MTMTLEGMLSPGTAVETTRRRPDALLLLMAQNATQYAVRRRPVSVASLVTPRTGYGVVSDRSNRNFAQSLERIQANTHLDWGQIARTLGVSRRTVHNWLSGTQVSGVNAARIATLYKAITQELAGNHSREDVRAYLLAPDSHGVTPLSRIAKYIREQCADGRPVVSAVDLLRAPSVPDVPVVTAGVDFDITPVEVGEK